MGGRRRTAPAGARPSPELRLVAQRLFGRRGEGTRMGTQAGEAPARRGAGTVGGKRDRGEVGGVQGRFRALSAAWQPSRKRPRPTARLWGVCLCRLSHC